MSAARRLITLTIPQEQILAALKEAADLLCNNHTHNIAPLDINPGEMVELYTMTLDCGDDDTIMQVEMWTDCTFKTITRCKKVTIPNITAIRGSLPYLQPRRIWKEDICNEILQLVRLTDPNSKWWRNDSIFKDSETANICYFYHPGFGSEVHQGYPRMVYAGYRAYVVGNHAPRYYRNTEWFVQLPSTGS
ncbi:hypothetical protein C7212DRAFT_307704 [Tuber magnatum]|uniref:Uncharacterized protein n=1 Tax=Tuber magnatum TaxID=42249 RepID=A0A317T3B8_9PEZI|nr:hypothetical protein C7212DRAFT_307704 [Tuber magnatum]